MSQAPAATHACSRCDKPLDCCAFCEEADCSDCICYRCLRVALGQAVPEPHAHGG
jgi:hypothetical protein